MSSSTGGKKRKAVKDEVYEYTGQEDVPKTVTHVKFHPSVVRLIERRHLARTSPFGGCTDLKEVVLNDGLREIGDSAFRNCTTLKSINIPSTVIKIGASAFYCNCKKSKLTEVILNDGLREIGGSAFQDCTSMRKITIPSTITKIGAFAFSGCIKLKEVVLTEGLSVIGEREFADCRALESITIPSTVTEVSCSAFNNCTNLREVVLNDGIKRIAQQAFEDCTSLERITIPLTVIEIAKYAFSGCTNLREVVILNEKIQIGDKSVFNVNCSSLDRFKFPRLFSRLDNIVQAGQRDIEAKMDGIHAVEWRGGELIIPTVHRQVKKFWGGEEIAIDFDKEKLAKIVGFITYYEVKEATTLFELALWRSNMVATDTTNSTDRGACRIEVPGPVKETVLQFLG